MCGFIEIFNVKGEEEVFGTNGGSNCLVSVAVEPFANFRRICL